MVNEDQNDDFETRHDWSSHSVQYDPPIFPPDGFISPFKTLGEWLGYVCKVNQPKKSISEYEFGVFTMQAGEYILSLTGWNIYEKKNLTIRRIAFEPAGMFFNLPQEEYGKLTEQQVRERLLAQLRKFAKTPVFQNSFLSKCELIRNNYADVIWSQENG
jgi:hypothetical protein